MTAVRVVVVEDSPVQRAHLVDVLEAERDIAVIGQAGDPVEAVALVQRLRPDVVTMDLGLPGDGGLGAIEQIMAGLPTPILVLSARVTCAGSAAAVESLLAGAVEALPKPERWDAEAERQLRCRVRLLSGVTVVAHPRGRRRPPAPDPSRAPPVAIAASTGGPAALAEMLPGLGGLAVPVLVVQHLHPQLVDGFVGWMQRVSALPVVVAADGDRPQPGSSTSPRPAPTSSSSRPRPVRDRRWGRPGPSRPAAAAWSSTRTRRACTGRRPTSCSARSPPPRAGRRSACCSPAWATTARPGCWPCAAQGAVTIAQDEPTSVVFGMPRAAQRLGAAAEVLGLGQIHGAIRGRRGRAGPMSTAGATKPLVQREERRPRRAGGRGLVAERTGIELGDGLRERLAAYLDGAARARDQTPARFAAGLAGDPGAFQELLDRVTVQETGFFRHPDQFAALAREVLPGPRRPGASSGAPAAPTARRPIAWPWSWPPPAAPTGGCWPPTSRPPRWPGPAPAATPPPSWPASPPAHRHWLRPSGDAWEIDPALRRRVRVEHANLTARFPIEPGTLPGRVLPQRPDLPGQDRDRVVPGPPAPAGCAPGGLVFLGYSEAMLAPTGRLRVEQVGNAFALRVVPEGRSEGLWTTPHTPTPASAGLWTTRSLPPRPIGYAPPPGDPPRGRRRGPSRARAPPVAPQPTVSDAPWPRRAGAGRPRLRHRRRRLPGRRPISTPTSPFAHLNLGWRSRPPGDDAAARRAYRARWPPSTAVNSALVGKPTLEGSTASTS